MAKKSVSVEAAHIERRVPVEWDGRRMKSIVFWAAFFGTIAGYVAMMIVLIILNNILS